MEATKPARSPGGGLVKALRQALNFIDPPRIAVVAATQTRAEFIRGLCLGVEPDGDVEMCLESGADDRLRTQPHELVVLDASLPQPIRTRLRGLAKERLTSCKVIEIHKWSSEPPA